MTHMAEFITGHPDQSSDDDRRSIDRFKKILDSGDYTVVGIGGGVMHLYAGVRASEIDAQQHEPVHHGRPAHRYVWSGGSMVCVLRTCPEHGAGRGGAATGRGEFWAPSGALTFDVRISLHPCEV